MQKFADEVIIEVSSGNGGNGCAAFHREKYVPKGGPSGGDGGHGGDVIFQVKRNLRTLTHLRYKQGFKAGNGQDGEGRGRYGRKGEDIIIFLPPGSILKDAETGELVRDFGKNVNDYIFLKGGSGGWGNIHFKSSTNQTPRKALPGKPGEKRRLLVELRILADIGLVGLPNAGKSSLLEKFTNARPKIASYPFTTKIPNLGVLTLGKGDDDSRDIIIADIPGLIEGASEGLGLGTRFLKHIARTMALAFLIDLGEDNYLEAFDVLIRELEAFSSGLFKAGQLSKAGQGQTGEQLTAKRRIIIGTKMDLEDAGIPVKKRLAELKNKYPDEEVLGISVFSGEGIAELAALFGSLVMEARA